MQASSLAVRAWPLISAARMVARAVSPTSAATSTRFAATTMCSLYRRSASIGKEREFGMRRTDGARQSAALLPGLRRARVLRRTVRNITMNRHSIRVEPLSSYAEARKVPIAMAVRAGDLVFVSNIPPYDLARGAVKGMPSQGQQQGMK